MTDDELRALVRDAIARHLGGSAGSHGAAPKSADGAGVSASAERALSELRGRPGPGAHRDHASHGLFILEAAGDGACVIEPAVACTHCGYCRSYGH